MRIEKAAIVGKGALGLLYADCIARTLGSEAVCFVMDEGRIVRHAGETTTINTIINTFEESVLKMAITPPTERAAKRITET